MRGRREGESRKKTAIWGGGRKLSLFPDLARRERNLCRIKRGGQPKKKPHKKGKEWSSKKMGGNGSADLPPLYLEGGFKDIKKEGEKMGGLIRREKPS